MRYSLRPDRKCLLILTAAILAGFLSLSAGAPPSIPWSNGDVLMHKWTLNDILVHPEFVRLTLASNEETTGVEITVGNGKMDEWSSLNYRVQASPGGNPPGELLREIVGTLRKWEKSQGHVPFIRKTTLDKESRQTENIAPENDVPKTETEITPPREFPTIYIILFFSVALLFFLISLASLRYVSRLPKKEGGDGMKVRRVANQVKLAAFWFAILLPVLLVIVLFGHLAIRIVNISRLDPQAIYSELTHLMERKGESFEFQVENGVTGYQGLRFIPFDYEPGQKLIYVFGGSSVVWPVFEKTFAFHLESSLNEEYGIPAKVFNFGAPGMTSLPLKNCAAVAIDFKKPDLIIIYSGHNDYTFAYRKLIKPNFFSGIVLFLNAAIIEPINKYLLHDDRPRNYHYLLDRHIEPKMSRLLTRLGILNYTQDVIDEVERIILDGYRKNIEHVLDLANEKDIPVILITPVGNLEERPYGIDDRAEELFISGMGQRDYGKKMDALIKAKNLDSFSIDLRAKSDMLNVIRSLRRPNLYVLDLESELIEYGFGFGYDDYYDIVHFNVGTHELYADFILWFMNRKRICCGLGEFRIDKPHSKSSGEN